MEYGPLDGIMEESAPCNPVNEYGKAKLEFYRQGPLCAGNLESVTTISGSSASTGGAIILVYYLYLTRDLPLGKTVSLSSCRHEWNFMYIEDAVQAVYELYRSGCEAGEVQSQIVNIAGSDTRPLRSFVEEIHQIAGRRGTLEYGTFVQAKEGPLSIRPDITKLKQLTGGRWQERYTFRRGIEETMEKEEAKET